MADGAGEGFKNSHILWRASSHNGGSSLSFPNPLRGSHSPATTATAATAATAAAAAAATATLCRCLHSVSLSVASADPRREAAVGGADVDVVVIGYGLPHGWRVSLGKSLLAFSSSAQLLSFFLWPGFKLDGRASAVAANGDGAYGCETQEGRWKITPYSTLEREEGKAKRAIAPSDDVGGGSSSNNNKNSDGGGCRAVVNEAKAVAGDGRVG